MNKRTQKKMEDWIRAREDAIKQIENMNQAKISDKNVSRLTRIFVNLGYDFIKQVIQSIIAEDVTMPEGMEQWYEPPALSVDYIDLQLCDEKGRIKTVEKWYSEFDWQRYGFTMWCQNQAILEKLNKLEKEYRVLKLKNKS